MAKAKTKVSVTSSKTKAMGTKKKHAPKVKAEKYYFKVYSGSLKRNITRFSQRFHYKLIWNVKLIQMQIDFSWVGNKTFVAPTSQQLLQQIMEAYPVQVMVWQGNRVICVTSNNSCVMRGAHV